MASDPIRPIKEHIETRLSITDPGQRPLSGDLDVDPSMSSFADDEPVLRPAAVLVPLVERRNGLTVLLTQRADHLSSHAGQVSFPGGRVEQHDESHVEAALRETEEEIGLAREFVSISGMLDIYRTGTGYAVHPVVGFVREGFDLVADQSEVAEIFEVPFEFLMDPANHQKRKTHWNGKDRTYYEMPYGNYYIWGATAGMLVNLYRRLYT